MLNQYVTFHHLSYKLLQIAKYKKWLRYTSVTVISGFTIVASGLSFHKSRNSQEKGRFFANHAHSVPSDMLRIPTWLISAANLVGSDIYSKLEDSQKRCTGIELIVQMIEDITLPPATVKTVHEYVAFLENQVRSVRSQYKSMDYEALGVAKSVETAIQIAQSILLKSFMEHGEFLDIFTPHLNRVPRDIDGKLIPNKDAGCCPPRGWITMVKEEREKLLTKLNSHGIVLLKGLVTDSEIAQVRSDLRIQTSYSATSSSTLPFVTRSTDPEKIFESDRSDDVSYTQLSSGRYAYQLRCSKLEPIVKSIHRSVMPIVWEYLSQQSRDRPSILNSILGDEIGDIKNRVFLSSVSLVCADPLAGKDSWHANNGSGGVVVIVPLTPYEEKTGSTMVIPGSHKSWSWPRRIMHAIDTALLTGGPAECTATTGDIMILDGRVMRKNLANEKYDRSKIFIAFHYDFTATPPPYQWLPTTLIQNSIANITEWMVTVYARIPGKDSSSS